MGLVGKVCLWPRFNLSQLDGQGSARGEGLSSAKQNMLACSQKLERGPSQTGKTNGCRQPVRAIEAKTWAKSLLTPGFALVDPDACQTWAWAAHLVGEWNMLWWKEHVVFCHVWRHYVLLSMYVCNWKCNMLVCCYDKYFDVMFASALLNLQCRPRV